MLKIGDKLYIAYPGTAFIQKTEDTYRDCECPCGHKVNSGSITYRREYSSPSISEFTIVGIGNKEYFYEYTYDNGYGEDRMDIDRISFDSCYESYEAARKANPEEEPDGDWKEHSRTVKARVHRTETI